MPRSTAITARPAQSTWNPKARRRAHHHRVEDEHHEHAREERAHKDGEPARRCDPETLDHTRLELEDGVEPARHPAGEGQQGQDPRQEHVEDEAGGALAAGEVLEQGP